MLSYISAKEAAEKWNISQRRVSVLCSENRINGAMMVGNMWIIPANAEKPVDKRSNKAISKHKKADKRVFAVTIEETVSETFNISAKNEEEAVKSAIEQYDCGELVLSPGKVDYKQLQVLDVENDIATEWIEF